MPTSEGGEKNEEGGQLVLAMTAMGEQFLLPRGTLIPRIVVSGVSPQGTIEVEVREGRLQVRLVGLEGKEKVLQPKALLLDFWATWCGPCWRAIPHLVALHKKFSSKGLTILGISLDRDPNAVRMFLRQQNIPYLVGRDAGGGVARSFRVRAIPTFYLVDASGRVAYSGVGFGAAAEELERVVAQLLEGKLEIFPAIGATMKPFSLPTPGRERVVTVKVEKGELVVESAYPKGKKEVQKPRLLLLEFFSTYYGPCIASVPHLKELHRKFGPRGMLLVSISLDRDMRRVVAFCVQNRIPYLVLMDDFLRGFPTAKTYGIRGIPYAFVVDSKGKIRWMGHPLALSERGLEALLAEEARAQTSSRGGE